MCGLIAVLSPQAAAAQIDLSPALDSMQRRGPDGRGSWVSGCGQVALGHTRLALVGKRHSLQPIENEDGQIAAVINGELYQHRRLSERLRSRGHRLRGDGDSELLVHLYEELGDALMDELRGQWAFVLYDQRRRRLLAARDRHGIKPLYVCHHDGKLWLASQVKALLASGVPARLDPEMVLCALSLQYPPAGHSLYRDIEVLPPGHALSVEAGRTQRWRWDRPAPIAESPQEPEQLATSFAERLREAVQLRTAHDAPLAAQLSGGVDSAAVLTSAAQLLPTPPRAFTVSFPNSPEDELSFARKSAAVAGAPLTIVRATPERLAAAWPSAVAAGEGLAVNAHLPAKWLLAQAVRAAGLSVVLTGEGADEVLYGYPHLRVDAGVTPAQALQAESAASLGLMLPDGEGLPLRYAHHKLGFIPSFLQAKACVGARLKPLLRAGFAEQLRFDPVERVLDSLSLPEQPGRTPVDTAARMWRQLALEGYILRTLGDGMEMAHSIEGRLPFLDARLSRWLDGLCWRDKLTAGQNKVPLRNAMRKRLHEQIRTRPKHPFIAPPLSGPLIDMAADAISTRRFRELPFIDVEASLTLLHDLPSAPARKRKQLDPALWLIASLAMLADELNLSVK